MCMRFKKGESHPTAGVAAAGRASGGGIGLVAGGWISSSFLQFRHELPHRMVEASGFNQPPDFPTQDFIKR